MIFSSLFAKSALGFAAAGSLAFGGHALKHDDVKKAHPPKPAAQMQISGSGMTLVRGAVVTAVSGNTITATTALGSTTITWTINTDSGTSFVASAIVPGIQAIAVGDTVSFSGPLVSATTMFTVKAGVVKDLSKLPLSHAREDKDKDHSSR